MDERTWYIVVGVVVAVPVMIGWTRLFPKAGWPWWAAFVPFYNAYILVLGVARLSWLWLVLMLAPVVLALVLEAADQSALWSHLMFAPVVQIVAVLFVNVEVARRFGKSEAFGLGLSLLGFVFYPLLGFGPDRYQVGEAVPPRTE